MKSQRESKGQPQGRWRRFVSRVRSFVSSGEISSLFQKAERAVEATYLDKPQAEANHLQAEGAATVIAALNGTDNACIQVGSLLVMKTTTADGKHAVVALTLTPTEIEDLQQSQAIRREPRKIREFFDAMEHRGIS